MKFKKTFFLLITSLQCFSIGAQTSLYPTDSIYLSGVVFDADSVNTLPYAHVILNNRPVGTTNADGQFLIHISRKDTVQISYMGFKDFQYIFPEKTYRDEFFIRIPLSRDSILLQTIDIYPWPKRGAFRQAFLDAANADKKDQKIIIPGTTQYDGPKKEVKPTIANPISLLQNALSKEARNKRKLKKYRKQMQEEYFEFER